MDKEDEYEVITLIVTKNFNKEWSETKSFCEILKAVKSTLEE